MLAILIHELGHAISAYRYGARRVSIGIGWYFIFPVAYADLSESWGFSVRQRMLSTIAGVFYQAVFGSLIFIGFLVTENMCFYSASIAILISILWNLNPFLRLDGYWLIVDLLDNPNLRKEGITSAKRLFKTPVSAEIKKTSIIVLVYGVISLLLLTFLLVKLSLEIYQTQGFGIYEIIKHVATSDNLGIADWVLYFGTSLWKGLALIFLSWQAYLYVQKKFIKQRTSH
ncbi:hypothetical protein [Aliikangiella marina]|nr:hypothetical protein [Aliikangiella marina]